MILSELVNDAMAVRSSEDLRADIGPGTAAGVLSEALFVVRNGGALDYYEVAATALLQALEPHNDVDRLALGEWDLASKREGYRALIEQAPDRGGMHRLAQAIISRHSYGGGWVLREVAREIRDPLEEMCASTEPDPKAVLCLLLVRDAAKSWSTSLPKGCGSSAPRPRLPRRRDVHPYQSDGSTSVRAAASARSTGPA